MTRHQFEAGVPGLVSFLLVAKLVGHLGEKGLLSDAEWFAVCKDVLNGVDVQQRDEAARLVKSMWPRLPLGD